MSSLAITLLVVAICLLHPTAAAASPAKFSRKGTVLQQQQQHQAYRYGVIVDCGSSGTRAHIFRWPNRKSDRDQLLADSIEQLKDPSGSGKPLVKRIRPGLSSLRDSPDMASDYMHPIMDFLSAHIPVEAQPDTPVFFLGTAGLRLLAHSIQKQILDDISRDLPRDYPNFKNLFTRVISGLEEGFYQWLSVNSFSSRLGASYDLQPMAREFYCQAPRARRFGLLEMGGASVQISFELSEQVDNLIRKWLQSDPLALRAYQESQIEFQLGDSTASSSAVVAASKATDLLPATATATSAKRRIFSATFLGFGSNNARNLAISLLIREAGSKLLRRLPSATILYGEVAPNATLLIEDPCLPVGSAEETRSGAALWSLLDQTRPIGGHEAHDYDDADEGSFNVRLYGGGNFAQCQRLLKRVLITAKRELINCRRHEKDTKRTEQEFEANEDGKEANYEPCTTHLLGRNFVPFQLFQFLGLGDFFYTTDLMIQRSGQFRLDQVLQRTVSICSLHYPVLLALYPEANRVDGSRVRRECFKATWMIVLLQVGFRMPTGSDFATVSQVNGQPLDWTTGAMIVRLFESQNHRELDRVQSAVGSSS